MDRKEIIMMKKIIAGAMAAGILWCSCTASVSALPQKQSSMRDITTAQLVKDMGIGINLGNTYESCGDWIAQWGDGTPESYETAWGSPVITQQMIQGYADAGFDTLRVPVAWSNMMEDNYTISDKYLSAVQEVVDWAIDCGLYVILNLHYDGGWLANFPTDKENCMEKYKRIWTQVSDAFADYSDYLVFESQNEELGWESLWNRWGGTEGKTDSYDLVNEINQTFVDIIRSSGGNNPQRHLLISGYNTDVELTCDSLFQMPNDPAGRCAVSVHYYTPSGFAILEEDASWGKMRSTWGTDDDYAELNRNMDLMKTTYVDKGIPVIIGEYGCPKKNKEEESVRRFLSSVCEAAYSRDMCPVMWDVTGLHYNRSSCKMLDDTLMQQLLAVKQSGETMLTGDCNEDGIVSVADAVLLQQYLLNSKSLSETAATLANCNGDGSVNGLDLAVLRQKLTA